MKKLVLIAAAALILGGISFAASAQETAVTPTTSNGTTPGVDKCFENPMGCPEGQHRVCVGGPNGYEVKCVGHESNLACTTPMPHCTVNCPGKSTIRVGAVCVDAHWQCASSSGSPQVCDNAPPAGTTP